MLTVSEENMNGWRLGGNTGGLLTVRDMLTVSEENMNGDKC